MIKHMKNLKADMDKEIEEIENADRKTMKEVADKCDRWTFDAQAMISDILKRSKISKTKLSFLLP